MNQSRMSPSHLPTIFRIATLSLGLLFSVASFGPGDPLPEPDTCTNGAAIGAASVELGLSAEEQFVPLNAGDIVDTVVGGQGSDMVALRYRVLGLNALCAEVSASVYRCEQPGCDDPSTRVLIGQMSRSLRLYDRFDGIATAPDFLILDGSLGGGEIFIDATVAGASAVGVFKTRDTVDAGPDAQPEDGGPEDAGLADAPTPDAS